MLDLLPYIIGAIALALAVLAGLGMERIALTAVLMALGSAQIHMAVASLGVFLVFANRWRITRTLSFGASLWAGALLIGILITTTIAPVSSRTYIELAQLALYVVLLMLTLSYIKTGETLKLFLQSSVLASLGVALLSFAMIQLDQVEAPSIFVGRGANEGAVFLSLLGAIPAAVLFVNSRNPMYLVFAGFFIYLQDMATSRGSVAVTAIVILLSLFFVFRSRIIRIAIVIAGIYVLFTNVPLLDSIYQQQINFSARERMALFYYALWLWQQKPIVGWGWGSTTDLAERAPTTELFYPHFHNTYVQFLVESGLVGVLIIGTFLYFCVTRTMIAMSTIRQPGVTVLTLAVFAALAVSGFFDALLYGADRAVQVVILLSWSARAVQLAPRVSDARVPSDRGAGPVVRARSHQNA